MCFQQQFLVYYSHRKKPSVQPCHTFCRYCRREIGHKANKDFLIDFMQSPVFDKGPVKPTTLGTKLLSQKGSIFLEKGSQACASDTHQLVLSLWVVDIISFHWAYNLADDRDKKVTDILCSFSKKSEISSTYRMNHQDNSYWELLPFIEI